MALHQLPFGYAEWRGDEPTARPEHPLDEPRSERLLVTVPAGLRRRLEASAALAGEPTEAWIARSLARSVDPRLLGA